MRLNDLQARLEQVYDLATDHRVEDFVLHDVQVARTLSGRQDVPKAPETLLFSQGEDAVDVALFLEAAVVERLTSDCPDHRLHAGNLQDFWLALEGVSHFLYLAWNAAYDRPITLLELELQAEVDKFVATASVLDRQQGRVPLGGLWRTLFVRTGLRPGLDLAERRRYLRAGLLAGRYCARLRDRFPGLRHGHPALERELRRFYRMGPGEKVRHIEQGTRLH